MTDFLLELLSEEIPARMQLQARADLEKLFTGELTKAGLKAAAIETHATPRRLVLIARDLPAETDAVSEELKGPRVGAPPQALEGFLRKTGLSADQLVEREGVLFAVIDKPGRRTAEVLAEAVPAIIRAFPWPKSMRWGKASLSTASLRWVRPLKGIVALLGDDVVPIEIDGIVSGAETLGHRFHHPGVITIGNANDYAAKLRACHVIVSHEERQQIIRDGAAKAAAAAGLSVIPDEGLVIENAGLTEWPVPILGSFDPAFLSVPREVIQLTMRTNQKYFALTDSQGKLAPNFICTANIDASDGGVAIAAGNAKVLAARLSDAKFFWEQDLAKVRAQGLDSYLPKLKEVIFHAKIGSFAEKVDRVSTLARFLISKKILQGDIKVAERAATLAKADLLSSTVGEFPELQGIIGSYLAIEAGESADIVAAIKGQYASVDDADFPSNPIAVAVAVADRMDTLVSFFEIGEKPTGSRDPFALRRAAISLIYLILNNNIRISLLEQILFHFTRSATQSAGDTAVKQMHLKMALHKIMSEEKVEAQSTDKALHLFDDYLQSLDEPVENRLPRMMDLVSFIIDRLKVQQREAGVRHDLIDAVFALGGEDDLVRLLARVKALQAFVGTEDGANLLAGYKRASNILKKEEWAPAPYDGERPAEEAALVAALDAAEPRAEAAIAAEDFEGAMAALASLRAPIDAFFDKVTVNDSDPAKRSARLDLLARVRAAVHRVADFSRIEG